MIIQLLNYDYENYQQEALYRLIHYSKSALHVSGVFPHHQENLTVFTVSGSVHPSSCRLRVWGRGEAYTGFWWGNLKERGHLANPGVNGRIILRWIFRKWDVGAWN
jgi:hypothetical protein